MNKYARLVFEERIPDDAQIPEILGLLRESIENYLKDMNIEDVEISNYPYERQE